MKYKMNKRVTHNGIDYPKDSEITKEADGFESMREAGHIDKVGAEGKSEQVEPNEEPAQSEKPAAKPKK